VLFCLPLSSRRQLCTASFRLKTNGSASRPDQSTSSHRATLASVLTAECDAVGLELGPRTFVRVMALREFTDSDGRHWKVWDVYPTLAERRRRDTGPPPGQRERRRHPEPRTAIAPAMAEGWLAFEASSGERRRLAPIPGGAAWHLATEDQLRTWCTLAKPAPQSRRLIE
jgi:hypothetical protein